MSPLEQMFQRDDLSHLAGQAERRQYDEGMLQMNWLLYRLNTWTPEEKAERLRGMKSRANSDKALIRIEKATPQGLDEIFIEDFLESTDGYPETRWYREIFLPSKNFENLKKQPLTLEEMVAEIDQFYILYQQQQTKH